MSGGPRDISRSFFWGGGGSVKPVVRWCWWWSQGKNYLVGVAKWVRSRTQAMFSGLSDGATITYFCFFRLLRLKLKRSSENRDLLNCCLTQNESSWTVNGAVQGGFWFAEGDWRARTDNGEGRWCYDVQPRYDCVINTFPLFSRYVKLPLAEEYSTPGPDKGTCNGSNGVVEGKVLSKLAGSFSALKDFISIWFCCVRSASALTDRCFFTMLKPCYYMALLHGMVRILVDHFPSKGDRMHISSSRRTRCGVHSCWPVSLLPYGVFMCLPPEPSPFLIALCWWKAQISCSGCLSLLSEESMCVVTSSHKELPMWGVSLTFTGPLYCCACFKFCQVMLKRWSIRMADRKARRRWQKLIPATLRVVCRSSQQETCSPARSSISLLAL